MHAEALTGVGRAAEAAALAEWGSREARARGMRWPLPLNLLALGRSRVATGEGDAREVRASAEAELDALTATA